MLAQDQYPRAVVLKDLPPRHRRECDGRLLGFEADHALAFVGCREQRHYLVRQALDGPERVTPIDVEGCEGIAVGQTLKSRHRDTGATRPRSTYKARHHVRLGSCRRDSTMTQGTYAQAHRTAFAPVCGASSTIDREHSC